MGRRSPEESLFLEELASWILFDCNLGTNPTIENDHDLLYDGDALLFSRSYHNGRNFYYADLTRSNVADAIKLACQLSKKDSLIAILGKGPDEYQEINGVKFVFSDVKEVLKFVYN